MNSRSGRPDGRLSLTPDPLRHATHQDIDPYPNHCPVAYDTGSLGISRNYQSGYLERGSLRTTHFDDVQIRKVPESLVLAT